jgi:hypothetical protein
VIVVAVAGVVLVGPASVLAVPARPFVHQLVVPPGEPGGKVAVGGVAVDAHDNVWVSEVEGELLDEFDSSGALVEALPLTFETPALKQNATFPQSLSIGDATEHFYVAGDNAREGFQSSVEVFDRAGKLLKREEFPQSHVAVDNSTDSLDPSRCVLSECTVYVAHREPTRLLIEKFLVNGVGEMTAAPFGGATKCETEKCGYIEGNAITGVPGESFIAGNPSGLHGMTVDGAGNIYVVDEGYNNGKPENLLGAVVEFSPEGVFLQAFTGEENPGLGSEHEGWGDRGSGPSVLRGVAVDPVNGDVVVSVSTHTAAAVDEFDPTGRFIAQMTEANGVPLGSAQEMAFDSAGNLYVVDGKRGVVDVYGPGLPPGLKLAPVSERGRTSATLNGFVNPQGLQSSDCHFEVVPGSQFEADGFNSVTAAEKAPCVPAASSIPADQQEHPVQAKLTGLVSGTVYYYRLLATTEGASGGTGATEPLAFTAPGAPVIDSSTVSNVSSRFADLRARIDPRGADTSYHFEYDTREYVGEEAHGSSVPAPDVDIGPGGPTGSVDASVLQQVGGLTAGATYHFRVVAVNEVEGVVERVYGPDAAFTTLPHSGEGLPDKRAYELLTPPNKGSAEDMFAKKESEHNDFQNRDLGYPSESGGEFLLETNAAFGSFAASAKNEYVFRRGAAGWLTLPLASPSLGAQSVDLRAFDPRDFSRVALSDGVGSDPGPAGIQETSLLGAPGGPYSTVLSRHQQAIQSQVVGASGDLSRVILQTADPALLPAGQYSGSRALYEWSEGAECAPGASNCTLVSVEAGGAPFACGAWLGQDVIPGTRHNAVSADGSRVFFTAPDPYAEKPQASKGCWDSSTGQNPPQLYARVSGQTVEVSAPEQGFSALGPVLPAIYAGASEDGSRVFFLTETELTADDAGHETSGAHDLELYECKMVEASGQQACQLTRVSAGEAGSPVREPGSTGSHVFTVPAVSADGSTVYFTAFGALTPGAPTLKRKEGGGGGPVNLYRYDTTRGVTSYVATIDTRDYTENALGSWWEAPVALNGILDEVALDPRASWYTTPDGRYLLFASTSALTGYSTAEASPLDCPVLDVQQDTQFGHCSEVYRYDSTLALSQGKAGVPDNPVCVSCDPSGASPVSDAVFGHGAGFGAPASGPVVAMSDNGSYAFFDTADPLVSQDSNGTQDVYEWEANGTPGCGLARGCVHLISSGEDPAPSYLLGASRDASNVFFGTHARLVPQDTDGAGDLYDARIDGGFALPAGKGPCEGDACQTPPPSPIDTTPISLTFSGPGNVAGEVKHKTTKSKAKKRKAKRKGRSRRRAKGSTRGSHTKKAGRGLK